MNKTLLALIILSLAGCAPDQPSPDPRSLCGDGECSAQETHLSCPQDCEAPPAPRCGDGTCNGTETQSTCSQDCGVAPPNPFCGDNQCNNAETCSSCPNDCGACPPPPPVTSTIVVQNYSSLNIVDLRIVPCGGTGPNLLQQPIYPNYMLTFSNVTPGCYDFGAAADNGATIFDYGQSILPGNTFTWQLSNAKMAQAL